MTTSGPRLPKQPHPEKVKITIFLPKELADEARAASTKADMNLSRWISDAVSLRLRGKGGPLHDARYTVSRALLTLKEGDVLVDRRTKKQCEFQRYMADIGEGMPACLVTDVDGATKTVPVSTLLSAYRLRQK